MTETTPSRTETAYYRDDSPEALEQEVNAERGRVAETLDALQEKMSVGNIIDDVVRSFSRYGGDMAGNLGRQVRHNPLPLLLTGVGLAWLMASSSRSRSRYREDEYLWDVEDDDDLYEEDFAGTRRYGSSHARPYGTAGVSGTYGERGSGTASSVKGAAGSAARGASGAVGSAASGVGHAAGSAGSGISHAAGSAARGVGRAAGAVGSGLGSAANALSSGARGASYGARHAGGSVREGAYRAYEAGRYSARRLDGMIQEHPLVMGALALAVGAAIGGALPRTRTEDEYLGEYSDSAKEAARATAERETEKARRVAGAVAEEARHMASEKYEEVSKEADRRLKDAADEGRSMAERGKAEAAGAAERLRDTAKSEAERQNLGDPKKPA